MGFSVSGAAAVIVLGLLYLGGTLANAQLSAHDSVRRGLDDAEARMQAKRQGALRVDSETYDGGLQRTVILATNTGGATFDAGTVDVLLDGVWRTSGVTSRKVGGVATEVWPPDTQLELIVGGVTADPAATLLVTATGAQDILRN